MNQKGLLTVLLTTGIIVLLVVVLSNFNFKLEPKSTQEKINKNNTVTDDHHAGQQAINSTIFDSLTGKPAPDFTLESYDGEKITLESLRGKNVILFFSEGLMCYPSCWNQIAAFGKDSEFTSKNTVVLTIVNDRKNDWRQAVVKMPELASAKVLFDTDRAVSVLYGALTLPSSMHRGQFAGHSYVIVDKEGIIRFARDDPQMAVRNMELSAEIDKL